MFEKLFHSDISQQGRKDNDNFIFMPVNMLFFCFVLFLFVHSRIFCHPDLVIGRQTLNCPNKPLNTTIRGWMWIPGTWKSKGKDPGVYLCWPVSLSQTSLFPVIHINFFVLLFLASCLIPTPNCLMVPVHSITKNSFVFKCIRMSLIKIGCLLLLKLILPGVSSGYRKQEFITVGCTWRLIMNEYEADVYQYSPKLHERTLVDSNCAVIMQWVMCVVSVGYSVT